MSLDFFKSYLFGSIMYAVPHVDYFEASVIELEDFINEMVFEFIREQYDRTAPKQSLHAHIRDAEGVGEDEIADESRQKYMRLMAFAQEARQRQYDKMIQRPIDEDFGKMEELRPPDMEDAQTRRQGYQINAMQFFELGHLGSLSLVKAVTNHRLADVKKISNKRFIEIMDEYDSFVEGLNNKSASDSDIIYNTMRYYVLEWKYLPDFAYLVVSELGDQDITDALWERVDYLCADLTIPREGGLPDDKLPFEATSTHSRFIQSRMKYLPALLAVPEKELFFDRACVGQYLRLKTYLMKFIEGPNGEEIGDWFAAQVSEKEQADFIRNDYWVFDKRPSKCWTPKKIRLAREVFGHFLVG